MASLGFTHIDNNDRFCSECEHSRERLSGDNLESDDLSCENERVCSVSRVTGYTMTASCIAERTNDYGVCGPRGELWDKKK